MRMAIAGTCRREKCVTSLTLLNRMHGSSHHENRSHPHTSLQPSLSAERSEQSLDPSDQSSIKSHRKGLSHHCFKKRASTAHCPLIFYLLHLWYASPVQSTNSLFLVLEERDLGSHNIWFLLRQFLRCQLFSCTHPSLCIPRFFVHHSSGLYGCSFISSEVSYVLLASKNWLYMEDS